MRAPIVFLRDGGWTTRGAGVTMATLIKQQDLFLCAIKVIILYNLFFFLSFKTRRFEMEDAHTRTLVLCAFVCVFESKQNPAPIFVTQNEWMNKWMKA